MIRFRKPAIAELKDTREQIASRLRVNPDYLALVAIDQAISQFECESLAQTEAVFRSWAQERQPAGGRGPVGCGPDNEGASE